MSYILLISGIDCFSASCGIYLFFHLIGVWSFWDWWLFCILLYYGIDATNHYSVQCGHIVDTVSGVVVGDGDKSENPVSL